MVETLENEGEGGSGVQMAPVPSVRMRVVQQAMMSSILELVSPSRHLRRVAAGTPLRRPRARIAIPLTRAGTVTLVKITRRATQRPPTFQTRRDRCLDSLVAVQTMSLKKAKNRKRAKMPNRPRQEANGQTRTMTSKATEGCRRRPTADDR